MDISPPISPPALAYKDRRTGLLVFGILEILLGCIFLLALPATVFGQVATAKRTHTELNTAIVFSSLLTPALLATGLIWLGIGSIKARRWARSLLLCLGWLGLCIGAASLPIVIASLSSLEGMLRQQGQNVSPGIVVLTKVVVVATMTVFYVIIPAVLVLFYRSPHVKLTCENSDPVECWTDRCPLPVIAICILQSCGALYILAMMPRLGAAFPLAGFVVTGWLSWTLWLGFIGLSAYAAWGFYHLQRSAWLIYTIAIVTIGLSSVMTFMRIDLLEYYRMTGLPEQQISQLAVSPLVRGHNPVWFSVLSTILFGGYLVYLRRYFVTTSKTSIVAG